LVVLILYFACVTYSIKLQKDDDVNKREMLARYKKDNMPGLEALSIKNATEDSPANSLGQHLKESQIREPPFKLERCDQVVLVQGERFLSYYDYGLRKPTFFEIGIYVVNIFEGTNSDKLIDSLEQYKVTKKPQFLIGTGRCLDLYNSSADKRYPICLESDEVMFEIQKVFEDFLRCRNGEDLQGGIHLNCQKELQSLPSTTVKTLFSQAEEEKKKKYNPYFSTEKVPGA
jgi:hypothetical protein